MTSITTTYLPLTTTFTAPAQCWDGGPWMYQNVPTTWWKRGGDNVPSCFPPAFPFSKSRIVYSPGICPGGWTSACERPLTRSGTTQNVISCCPASFECASTSSAVHDWEDQFGCASPYSVDTAGWNMKSDDRFVNSIYQLQVMIIDTTSTLSSTAVPALQSSAPSTSSQPTSTSASIASTTDASNPALPSQGGLSPGAIAGVAIGAVVGLAIIVLLAFIARTVRKNHRVDVADSASMVHNLGEPASSTYNTTSYYARNGSTFSRPELENTSRTELDTAQPPVQIHELKSH